MTAYTFDQLITFTRTSAATYVNSSGNIASTPQSRNLLTFTQELVSGSSWDSTTGGTGVAPTLTANVAVAPDGTMTADRLQFSLGGGTTASDISRRRQLCTTPATTHTFSIYLRSTDGSSTYNMHLVDPTGATIGIVVTGTWQRFSVTATGTGAAVQYAVGLRGGQSPANSNTADILAWGAQLEASSAASTYTRNNGGVYPPRFDYDPVTRAPRGLLIEEQRTNLLVRSEEFDNAAWTKTRCSILSNNIAAPDGTLTADKLVEDSSNDTHQISSSSLVPPATPHIFSLYAKKGERNWVVLRLGGVDTFFDLVNGTASPATNAPTITSVGDGWYRCAVTSSAGLSGFIRMSNNGSSVSYQGDGTSGIFIWGAQLEAGAFATSYIPTVASQVTRTADVAAITAPMFAPWYNAAEGTMVLSASVLGSPGAATVSFAQLSNGSSNNFEISLGMFGFSAPSFQVVNSTTQANLDLGSMAAGQIVNMAGAYKTNDFAGVLDGGTVQTDTSGSIPSGISTLGIGFRLGGVYMNGHIQSIDYYPTRLTNAQIQALTA